MNILEYLRKGKGNKLSTIQLCGMTGLKQRQLCKAVEQARLNGAVILTNPKGGYWLPDENDPDIDSQLSEFIGFMLSKNTFSTVKSARIFQKQLHNKNQLHLEV